MSQVCRSNTNRFVGITMYSPNYRSKVRPQCKLAPSSCGRGPPCHATRRPPPAPCPPPATCHLRMPLAARRPPTANRQPPTAINPIPAAPTARYIVASARVCKADADRGTVLMWDELGDSACWGGHQLAALAHQWNVTRDDTVLARINTALGACVMRHEEPPNTDGVPMAAPLVS